MYDPSMAASNDRMVSRGRSRRGRVGFDRSGSTGESSASLHLPKSCWSAPIILPCASRCWMLRMDSMVDFSKAVAAGRLSAAAPHRQCKMRGLHSSHLVELRSSPLLDRLSTSSGDATFLSTFLPNPSWESPRHCYGSCGCRSSASTESSVFPQLTGSPS